MDTKYILRRIGRRFRGTESDFRTIVSWGKILGLTVYYAFGLKF